MTCCVLGGTLVDDRSARPGDIAVADGRIVAVTRRASSIRMTPAR